jgi:hypothetical protein
MSWDAEATEAKARLRAGVDTPHPTIDRAHMRREIAADLNRLEMKPYEWVLWAYPWGQPGTPLENETGPDEWQRIWLKNIGDRLEDDPFAVIREALASGHGIGKTTGLTWLIQWAETTFPMTRGVVTANTDSQLKSKTWAEMHKWWGMVNPILRDEFVLTATAFYSSDKRYEKNWRIDAVPWSDKNPAAFAGLHNSGNRILIVMDEGSEISDKIYEVVEGATTDKDTQIIWAVFGNPTRNTGYFKRIIEGDLRTLWGHKQIDSRTVSRTNKTLFEDWAKAYGDDSDFYRVRVKGMFPRASSTQFIREDVVQLARKRAVQYGAYDALVYGLDVARQGDDQSVLAKRKGRDARTLPWKRWRIPDLMQLANFVAAEAILERPAAIFVDVTGMGWGVFDRLRQMNLPDCQVFDVDFGAAGGEAFVQGVPVRCTYQVDRIWVEMREWLPGGCIPDDDELMQDLVGREYGFDAAMRLRLEQKDHMKGRGLSSPDNGDALALTFTHPVGAVAKVMLPDGRQVVTSEMPQSAVSQEHDPHADLRR